MKKYNIALFFSLFLINILAYGQSNGKRKVVYDDWPVTVPSNAERGKSPLTDISALWVPIGTTWDHRIMTYFFQNGTLDIPGNNEEQAIRDGFDPAGTHWRIIWAPTDTNHSVTEGGSSGSSLINNNRKVIGQLHGGLAGCNSQ
ncbi:hypothetical protein [Algoriphagus sp.]|uniref:hypothetical protein n=1 Tax=Algoriphagus sp. TaxID=1872435 RepID=UPI003F71E430